MSGIRYYSIMNITNHKTAAEYHRLTSASVSFESVFWKIFLILRIFSFGNFSTIFSWHCNCYCHDNVVCLSVCLWREGGVLLNESGVVFNFFRGDIISETVKDGALVTVTNRKYFDWNERPYLERSKRMQPPVSKTWFVTCATYGSRQYYYCLPVYCRPSIYVSIPIQVNSALHPSGVTINRVPASAGLNAGKSRIAGWQVTLCDPLWHVISRSGVVISITNCYILPLPLYRSHSCNLTLYSH